MRTLVAVVAWCLATAAFGQEADHELHQELRALLQNVQAAINAGNYDQMLPLLDERIEATSITQEVMSNRAEVSAYFREWFGPDGYMKRMSMQLQPDALTQFSPDKTFGLVRGSGIEHYEAKDGDQFDFKTRWTAVLARNADGMWRLRAIHFGTNHLDNPVLTKVSRKLVNYGIAGAVGCLVLGLAIGWWAGRRSRLRPAGANS